MRSGFTKHMGMRERPKRVPQRRGPAKAAEGGVIVIERRGEPVAELRPIFSPVSMPAGRKALIFDSMREIWARMPQVSDSTKIIEEDRDR